MEEYLNVVIQNPFAISILAGAAFGGLSEILSKLLKLPPGSPLVITVPCCALSALPGLILSNFYYGTAYNPVAYAAIGSAVASIIHLMSLFLSSSENQDPNDISD
ncbi:MAG: hypothetical protein N3A71_03300 [Candidatus Dojkabacteria bacterium]|nr:hypothetical protein [Candidatus Dojkabacteria bacterium]